MKRLIIGVCIVLLIGSVVLICQKREKPLETAASAEKRVAMVNGQPVWYREEGAGIPILILAGWGGPTDSYFTIQDKLANKGYRVFLPDLPGLPGKTPSAFIPLDKWSSWVQEFGKVAIGEKFFIIAHSLSAQIALQYTLKGDTECRGVIFLDPWFLSYSYQKIYWRLVAQGVRFLCPLVYPDMKWVKDGRAWATALDLLSIVNEQSRVPCVIILGKRDPATYLFIGWQKVHCETKRYNWDHSPQIRATDQLATVIGEFISTAVK